MTKHRHKAASTTKPKNTAGTNTANTNAANGNPKTKGADFSATNPKPYTKPPSTNNPYQVANACNYFKKIANSVSFINNRGEREAMGNNLLFLCGMSLLAFVCQKRIILEFFQLSEAPVDRAHAVVNRQFLCKNSTGTGEWVELCHGGFLKSADSILTMENNVDIVQIGAHVGFEGNDPIAKGITQYLNHLSALEKKKLHWTFVEPSPPNYKRLMENLANYSNMCDMRSVNAAVVSDSTNNTDGMVFYSISETIDPETGHDSKSGKTLPTFITQVSSFSKAPILFNRRVFTRRGLNVGDYIVETNVTTRRYSELMKDIVSNKGQPPLLVLIDTEGFDCDIILGVAESSPYLPTYLVFENNHCGKDKLTQTYAHLTTLGYSVKDVKGTQNAVAMRNETVGNENS